MKRTALAAAVLGAALLIAAAPRLGAQQTQSFDPEQFFEQLRLNGVSTSEGFDARKFFEKLQMDGVSDKQPLDAKAFFDRLQTEGVKMPADFDPQKFWEGLAARGASTPAMITPPLASPTVQECKAGWDASGKWDQALFNRLCQSRM
jgi:hypothetical protein